LTSWQAIVFDLDDTLYPEHDYVLSGFRAVASWAEIHLNIPIEQGYGELGALFYAGVRGDTFDRWLTAHDAAVETLVPQVVQVYRDCRPVLQPFLEVPDLLTRLHQSYRLGLVSDGYIDVQQRKLDALGLASYFDAVVFSDEWGRESWKPSPKPFQAVSQRLDVAPSATTYVGDNPLKDFLGARQIGMFTVQVHRPGGEYAHQAAPTCQHAADHVISSLMELEEILNR
jgi:putative hydrolase of the HAD superfamily